MFFTCLYFPLLIAFFPTGITLSRPFMCKCCIQLSGLMFPQETQSSHRTDGEDTRTQMEVEQWPHNLPVLPQCSLGQLKRIRMSECFYSEKKKTTIRFLCIRSEEATKIIRFPHKRKLDDEILQSKLVLSFVM